MRTHFNNSGQPDWEDLLEYATEAMSEYLWALEAWRQPPEEYSRGFLLQAILASRARGRQALSRMATAPSNYQEEIQQLQRLWEQGEGELREIVQQQNAELQTVVNRDWLAIIQQAEAELLRVRALGQDAFLLEDEEWVRHEREEAAAAFLTHWLDLSLCRQELSQEPLVDVAQNAFQEQFDRVDGLLRRYFDYFGFFRDAFQTLAATEYVPELWWLQQVPQVRDVAELEAQGLEALENLLAQAFSGRAAAGSCQEAEKVIAYTLGELPPQACREIREHLVACEGCFDLMLDVRLAESQAAVVEGIALEELNLPLPSTPAPGPGWSAWVATLPAQVQGMAREIGAALGNLAEASLDVVREAFSVAPFQLAYARQTLGGVQTRTEVLEQVENPLRARLKRGRRGGYPLLTQNQSESPAYQQLYANLTGRTFYWKIWALHRSGKLERIPEDVIGQALMGPCHTLPDADYTLVILALATEREPLQDFIRRVEAGEAAPGQPVEGVAVIFFTPETQQESHEQV